MGLEQPFPASAWTLHEELKRETSTVPLFADESFQGLGDLDQVCRAFDGVNIKLAKCGGIDRAMEIARNANGRDLRVMLGSMSEGALGCAAAWQLSGLADLCDLDGPWLIRNDPFQGFRMVGGVYEVDDGPGLNVSTVHELNWALLAHN